MKCPLMSSEAMVGKDIIKSSLADCLQEECAWWDTIGGVCAINSIRHSLRTLCVETNKVAKELILIRPGNK